MESSESSDIEALHKLLEAELEATRAANVDAMMALRTEDFVSMPPNQPAVEGHKAIREFLGQMLSSFDPSSVNISWKDVVACGDLGFARGEATFRPTSGDDPIDGKMILILRRQSDDVWKLARAIWNVNVAG